MTVTTDQTLVSVITPVYNGAEYLETCVQSVLGQTWQNFEYIIVDNCSTDASLALARRLATDDSRIRVFKADEHVGPIANWNRSLQYISPSTAYVKFVHADDWLFGDCLEKMIRVAEQNPTVGIVSAWRLEEDRVTLGRVAGDRRLVPYPESIVVPGRELARDILLRKADVLGSPSNILIRAQAMNGTDPFYDETYLHADKESCLRLLDDWDLAFVRQVLTYTRRHNESVSSSAQRLDTRRHDNLRLLLEYGPRVLNERQYQAVLHWDLDQYQFFLGRNLFAKKGQEFWAYHRENLQRAGQRPRTMKMLAGLLAQARDGLRGRLLPGRGKS